MAVGDVNSDEVGSGARYNDGKAPYDLIPLVALEGCARVFGYGSKKYAPFNWAKGMAWSVPVGCLLRHLAAFQAGEDTDPESGESHVSHMMANLVMLALYERTYRQGDDRPSKWLKPAATPGETASAPPDASVNHGWAARFENDPLKGRATIRQKYFLTGTGDE